MLSYVIPGLCYSRVFGDQVLKNSAVKVAPFAVSAVHTTAAAMPMSTVDAILIPFARALVWLGLVVGAVSVPIILLEASGAL